MKSDKFVHEHLDYIDGRIKLASCERDIVIANCNQRDKITDSRFFENSAETNKSLNNGADSDATNCSIIKDIEDISNESIETNANDTVENTEKLNFNICENWRGLVRKSPERQCSDSKKKNVNPLIWINARNGIM